jgi:C4-dicarboxylate-specific signal transduction histidine kinase
LGRVAAGIIHELRSPLSGINVYLSTLKKMYQSPGGPKGESLEKGAAILARLQSASDKIESVIKRTMDFARPGLSELRPTDINHAIEEAIGLSAVLLRKNGIKVNRFLGEKLPMCYTDSPLIQQVILNLITNAVQAMKTVEGEKRVEVSSWSEENLVCISIADSGPGVAPALRRKIFDPFFTTKQEGVGIGLSLCHRVISDHGGSLSVSTSKWGGAEFQVQIPIEKRKQRI